MGLAGLGREVANGHVPIGPGKGVFPLDARRIEAQNPTEFGQQPVLVFDLAGYNPHRDRLILNSQSCPMAIINVAS